ERSGDPWGLGRIEERRGDRSVEGDSQLAIWLALRTDLGARRRQDEEQHESSPSYEVAHLEPPDTSSSALPIVMDPSAYRCADVRTRALVLYDGRPQVSPPLARRPEASGS